MDDVANTARAVDALNALLSWSEHTLSKHVLSRTPVIGKVGSRGVA